MKPWMKTLLRRTAWTVGSLLALWVGVMVVENWRGERAWKAWQAERIAAGEQRDLNAYAPPAVPDAENFAKAECVARTLTTGSASAPERASRKLIVGLDAKLIGNWRTGKRMDFASLPLKDIEQALKEEAPALAEWTEAARRPACRLQEDYRDPNHVPALLGWRAVVRVFRIRALLALHQGLTEAALKDVETGFRIARHLEREPQLISQLLHIAILNLMLQPVWEGLQDGRWNEAQLARLETALAGQDLLASLRRAWTVERLGMSVMMTQYAEQHLSRGARLVRATIFPEGWLLQNVVRGEKAQFAGLESAFDLQARRLSPVTVPAMQGRTPYTFLVAPVLPALSGQNERCAETQSALDMARVALALERHRLTQKAYPASLAALTPGLLPNLPHDLVTGEPLRYRLKAEGGYTLYVTGWDGKDDGGVRIPRDKDNRSTGPGDWVWR